MQAIEVRQLSDGELIIREAEDASREVERLEAQKLRLTRELADTQSALVEAANRKEKASFAVQKANLVPDPPLPSLEELIANGIQQCPGRPLAEIQAISARMHAAIAGTSRIGVNVESRSLPAIEGEAVRALDNHIHDIPAPSGPGGPASPKFVKHYHDSDKNAD